MKIKPDFENLLKEISVDYNIRENPNNPDIAGVYWRETCMFGIPPNEIYKEKSGSYVDQFGRPHRGYEEALELAKAKYQQLVNNPEDMELMGLTDAEFDKKYPIKTPISEQTA